MDVTITKLVHACLLIEINGNRILLDPGIFTWQDERFDLSMVEGIDRILITHEHADHVNADLRVPVKANPAVPAKKVGTALGQVKQVNPATVIQESLTIKMVKKQDMEMSTARTAVTKSAPRK